MKADVSSGVRSLEPQYYFGLTVGSGNNCFFLNDEKIVYRAAGVIVVHDLLNHSQQYVYLTDSQKTITTMDLNHGKNFVAVAESGKRPTASVYDLVKSKRIRHLTLPYVTEATGFVMIKFSHDDVYLAALTNKPDFVMYYYEWRKSKIVSHLRVVHLPNSVAIVNDMVLNPGNNKLCCFVGKGLFRSMIMGEVVWKQYGFYKANKYNFTSACWLNDERLIAGTSEGQLFLFSKAELKAIYNVETLLKFDPRLTIDNPYNVRPPSNKRNMEIRCCTPVDGGLLMVVGKDQVYYYEVSVKNDPPYKKHALLERHTVYELPKNKHLEQIVGNDGKLRVINTLCVSPSGEMLMCITQRSLFYWASIGIENIDKTVELKLHGDDLHHGEVAGLSLSCWWPVFMTCGRLDRTVKLWNYVKRTLLFTERYDEDVLNVSLHPTGQCALLAFTSKVEFCMVHADQLETRRHFNVTDCSLIQFSRSGQMFALVDGLNVDIYSSITFEKLHRISKHEKKVTIIKWSPNDWKLYSVDVDNSVCQFDLFTEKIIKNIHQKNQNITDLTVSPNSKSLYTVDKDGRIREMYSTTMIHDKNLENGSINCVLQSRSNKMMFAACQYGAIVSVLLPITTKIKFKAFHVHNQSVTEMGLTSDDATLITCAVDGSMCIWAVQDEKPAVKPLEHILVSSKRLSRKIDVIEKLTDRLDELKELFDEETDKLGKEYDEKLRDLNEQHALAEKQLKDEHKKMVAMLEANETQLKNEIDTRTEEHDTDLNTLIEDYENKIYRADKAYDALDKKMSDIKDESKKKADINVLVHKQTIQELDEQLIKDLKKRDDDFLKFKEDLINEKNQICVEIDEFDNQGYREVLELNTKYTAKLKKWTKKTQNAKDEMKVFEKNLNKAEKVRQDMKHLVDKYQEDIKQKIISNKELDEDILEKEMELQKCGNLIKEKDSLMSLEQLTLKDVEEQISESKFAREDQEKIIEPLKDEQVNLDIVISEMQKLLNETDLEIEKIKMSYASIEDKIKSSRKQVKQDKETALAQDELILSARVEIYKISSSTAPEKQKIALKNLLHSKLANENYLADDVNSELLRQRQFYERCLTHLTRRVSASQMKKPALYKLIEENERLVKDLSKLKEEAETNRVQYNELVNSLRQSKKK